jgi:hypothetical protein
VENLIIALIPLGLILWLGVVAYKAFTGKYSDTPVEKLTDSTAFRSHFYILGILVVAMTIMTVGLFFGWWGHGA